MKTTKIARWFHALDARRAGALALGAGLVGIGLDAAIAHFAGREMKSVLQLVPVIAGPLAFVAVATFAAKRWSNETLKNAMRAIGALVALVGAIGTGAHVAAFMRLMEGTAWSMKDVELALAVAPPLAAPAAFIALGGLLALLVSPRISIEIKSGARGASPSHASAAA
jgi:hypothetical protein